VGNDDDGEEEDGEDLENCGDRGNVIDSKAFDVEIRGLVTRIRDCTQ
jgi:hypothetical protein